MKPERALLTRWLHHWLLGLQALLSFWGLCSVAGSSPDALAIPPGSPPSDQQRQFAQRIAGIQVFEAPEQTPINDFRWIKRGIFELGYTDHIFIRGLVLSVRRYDRNQGDEMADISPIDIVVGWQRMSDPAVVSQIHILQRDRFYYWRVEDFPIPRDEIELTSTNLHMIGNSQQETGILFTLKPGDLISVEGYLTDIKKPDGFIWSTSRVRDDHGDGACEIVMVHRISILQSLTEGSGTNN